MTFIVAVARREGVKARILRELDARKEGLTIGNLEKITGMSHFYIRQALVELDEEGRITRIPKSNGRKGRTATLIKLKEEGGEKE
jgi:predicted transcriptional regulator